MNPWPLVMADFRRNRVGALAVVLLVALAVALGVAVSAQDRALRQGSARAADKFTLIIGAPGGETQLVLSSVYLQPAAIGEVRFGYRATPRLTAEGRLTVGRPSLRVSLSDDVENAAPLEATNTITEYAFEGGALWRLTGGERRRWTPFVSGGAGMARHVHDGRTLVQDALSGYAGGGTLYALGSSRGEPTRAGLRFDARLQLLHGGIAEGTGVVARVAATAGFFVLF